MKLIRKMKLTMTSINVSATFNVCVAKGWDIKVQKTITFYVRIIITVII